MGKKAAPGGEPIWRGNFTDYRGRFSHSQPPGERRLSACRPQGQRRNGLEDRSLAISVRVVDSGALASRRHRGDCGSWRRLQAESAADGIQPRGRKGALVGGRAAAVRKKYA